MKKLILAVAGAAILSVVPLSDASSLLNANVAHAAEYYYGYTKNIGYYDSVPTGFIVTYASPFRDYRTVTYVEGAKYPTSWRYVTGTRLPAGWVITEMGAPHDPYTYSDPTYSTTKSLVGAPIGAVEWVHPDSKLPAGWAITEIRRNSLFWWLSTMRIVKVN